MLDSFTCHFQRTSEILWWMAEKQLGSEQRELDADKLALSFGSVIYFQLYDLGQYAWAF